MLMMATGFAVNVLLAKLLLPQEFGAAAAINVVVSIGKMASVGGLAIYFVRTTDPPTPVQLNRTVTTQLLMWVAAQLLLMANLIGVTVRHGDALLWSLVCVSGLIIPFNTLRGASVLQWDRRLDYHKSVVLDVGEQLTERRRVIRYFERSFPTEFDLYGDAMAQSIIMVAANVSE